MVAIRFPPAFSNHFYGGTMTFKLSNKSQSQLSTVHPQLRHVVERALELSTTDFSVNEGLRTEAAQRANIQKGVSQTMKSKHLKQADGYAHAVDLVPYPLNWDLKNFYPIATAMKKAAEELSIKIRWGGCWCMLNGDTRTPQQMAEEYTAARRKAGNKAFIDGPHFELVEG